MEIHNSQRYCLATVSSANFVPGTIVLIHSFLKTNPWFNGDIAIINDELGEDKKAAIKCLSEQCYFLEVSDCTRQLVHEIGDKIPRMRNRLTRFLSVEFLTLEWYDKVG